MPQCYSVTYVIRGVEKKKSIAHRHSYILTVFVSFCPQCWLIQSRLRLRFHPQLSVKMIATKTVVNIGDYFFCSPHIWPMNKSISWTCVMVVEGMMVWFLFSFFFFFNPVHPFAVISPVHMNCEISAFSGGVGILSSDVMSCHMWILKEEKKKQDGVACKPMQ